MVSEPREAVNNKRKLLLMVPSLHQGGYERVCVRTAQLLAPWYDITVCIFRGGDEAYDTTGLRIVNLDLPPKTGKAGKAVQLLRRAAAVRKFKKREGIEISYSFGISANLVNCMSKGTEKVFAGLRSFQDFDVPRKLRYFIRKADGVACCSGAIAEKLQKEFGAENAFAIWNPIAVPDGKTNVAGRKDLPEEVRRFTETHGKLVMSMGREDSVKGFWHLLKAFYLIDQKSQNQKNSSKTSTFDAKDKDSGNPGENTKPPGLMIIGSGSFAPYRALAEQLGIAEDVCFTGVLNPPFPLLSGADAYVLSSSAEGLPNGLLEAMALGVPVIASDCPTGPAEILGTEPESRFGILVPCLSAEPDFNASNIPDEDWRLADTIGRLLSDNAMNAKLREGARKRAADFSEDAYIENFRKQFR